MTEATQHARRYRESQNNPSSRSFSWLLFPLAKEKYTQVVFNLLQESPCQYSLFLSKCMCCLKEFKLSPETYQNCNYPNLLADVSSLTDFQAKQDFIKNFPEIYIPVFKFPEKTKFPTLSLEVHFRIFLLIVQESFLSYLNVYEIK